MVYTSEVLLLQRNNDKTKQFLFVFHGDHRAQYNIHVQENVNFISYENLAECVAQKTIQDVNDEPN